MLAACKESEAPNRQRVSSFRPYRCIPSSLTVGIILFAYAQGKIETRPVRAAEEIVMDSIIYIVGVVVIVMVVAGYFGFA
jgi:hypothetical protein